ncbi:TniQ family protein [Burkholderia sp. BC1]|uniref:TniQ family protein n=1 Tax=Burkholderia sp. BC1 TaxID=1095370 RepID=UPI004043CA5F
MLCLPFIPPAYPDEILGSWLARVRLHNGVRGWRTQLEAVGLATRTPPSLFDIAPYSKAIENLLESLYISYEETLLTLTTLPYRLTFGAANLIEGHLPGAPSLPKLIVDGDTPSETLRCITNSHRSNFKLRFCPLCIAYDYRTYGEPFWHRAHQLPNILWCPQHRIQLYSECPNCHRFESNSRRYFIELPCLRCKCGHDLSTKITPLKINSALSRLTKISTDALNNKISFHSLHHIKSATEQLILPIGYTGTLRTAFGDANRSVGNGLLQFPLTNLQLSLSFNKSLCHATAREYCALLAATHIDLDTIHTIASLQKNSDHSPTNSLNSEEITIEKTRIILTERMKKNPQLCASHFHQYYWFARLYDNQWLKSQRPHCRANHPIPSYQDDRRAIEKLITKAKDKSLWQYVAYSRAGMRARLRDRDWFNIRYRQALRAIQAAKRANESTIAKRNIGIVNKSFHKLSNHTERPIFITTQKLAELAHLTSSQVATTLSHCADLHKAINEHNTNLPLLRIQWAIDQSPHNVKHIKIHSILKIARIWNTSKNRSIAKMLLSTHQ